MVLGGLASEQCLWQERHCIDFYTGAASVRIPCTIENNTQTRSFLKSEVRVPTEFPVNQHPRNHCHIQHKLIHSQLVKLSGQRGWLTQAPRPQVTGGCFDSCKGLAMCLNPTPTCVQPLAAGGSIIVFYFPKKQQQLTRRSLILFRACP